MGEFKQPGLATVIGTGKDNPDHKKYYINFYNSQNTNASRSPDEPTP